MDSECLALYSQGTCLFSKPYKSANLCNTTVMLHFQFGGDYLEFEALNLSYRFNSFALMRYVKIVNNSYNTI